MAKRILLIDADVLAYEACAVAQQEVEFAPGYFTWQSSFEDVEKGFDHALDKVMTTLKGDDFKLCLTDSDGNFRKSVLPTYKSGRSKKPLVLKRFKEYLIEERQAYFKPTLEGDDCMGILATWPKLQGEKIIVSIDKDMKTIPGRFCRWGLKDAEGKPKPFRIDTISEAEADYWHLYQTLTGDVTDGYAGCPGVGPKKAEAILFGSSPPWGTREESWAAIVAAYEKAGKTEEDALVQARVARILRASDYDFQKKEPILWNP